VWRIKILVIVSKAEGAPHAWQQLAR
jgi:hypothetical protein